MPTRLAKRVLLVGWDAADWKMINPLVDGGQMPTLAGLIDRGVAGNIATLFPALSPILWTSITTGKHCDKHGILGFIEPLPDGSGVRPVASTSRKCKALWNILSQNGIHSSVFGWYASHPAEPINGVSVSNMYGRARNELGTPIKLLPHTVHPERLIPQLQELVVHPSEITVNHVLPFCPTLKEEHLSHPLAGKAIIHIRELLADIGSLHAAVTHVMATEPWEFIAVYYDAIDLFAHEFMQCHPPRMPHISSELFELFKDVMVGCYRFHDMMLQTLIDLAGPDTAVILVSDHGFHSDHLRPIDMPSEPTGPASWHRSHGVLVMNGPHIRKDERVYGSTLLDIAPTVLTMFGLPVGKDMDGKIIVNAFEQPPQIERIDSWENVEGDAGLHPPEMRTDPIEAQQAVQQLIDLGYIQAPSGSDANMVQSSIDEAKYNLGSSLQSRRQTLKALEIFEELLGRHPGNDRFAIAVARNLIELGQFEQARATLTGAKPESARSAAWNVLMGLIEFHTGHQERAEQYLAAAERLDPENPLLAVQVGTLLVRRRQYQSAERSFRRALELDPDAAAAWFGLGSVDLELGRNEQAAESFLRCVGLVHYLPRGHFYLGVALARMEQFDRAAQAIEIALSINTVMPVARRYLASLYMQMGKPEKAALHMEIMKRRAEAVRQAKAKAAT